MNSPMMHVSGWRWLACALALTMVMHWAGAPARCATITVVNLDGPNEGFNDPTPVSPIGGNTGTTLGAQRWIAMNRAAEIWGAQLSSVVPVVVQVRFDPLDCGPSSGTLGSAGAFTFFRDFVGAPRAGTYYPVALANMYAGQDLDPQDPDIVAMFNSSVGSANCLSSIAWYYGLDGQAPANAYDFYEIVLHELAHGLGFVGLVNLTTGAKANGFDDIYMTHLEDHSTGKRFPAMTDLERRAAITDSGDLHWVGSNVVAQSGFLYSGRHPSGHVEIYAPSSVQPGSSLSHFSSSLGPDELMEPFATAQPDRRLTAALLHDLGWNVLTDAPRLVLDSLTLSTEECEPFNQNADPGETVSFRVALRNTGQGVTKDLLATWLPNPQLQVLSTPQSYGSLAGGGTAQTRSFTLIPSAPCGSEITSQLRLQDGTNDLGTLSLAFTLGTRPPATVSFSNNAPVSIPATGKSGIAAPYPSSLTVSGLTNPLAKIRVTLRNLSHGSADDLDVLLVGPQGQSALLMSDAGGRGSISGVTLTFDDDASVSLAGNAAPSSGTYLPTNFGDGDSFPSPAPNPPYGSTLGTFRNTNPNGTWRLFLLDDAAPGTGQLADGWSLELVTTLAPVCCSLTSQIADLRVIPSPAPSGVAGGSDTTFVVTVTNAGPNTASSVRLTNLLSGPLSLLAVTPSQGSTTVALPAILTQLGSLAPNSAATVQVTLHVGDDGVLTNRSMLTTSSTDPQLANNHSTQEIPIDARPSLVPVPDQTLAEDSPSPGVVIQIADPDTPGNALQVSARSTNTNLFGADGLVLTGSDLTRTLSLRPATNQSGTAAIIVTVQDGFSTAGDLFVVNVTAVNDPPVLTPLTNQAVFAGMPLVLQCLASDVDSSLASLRFHLDEAPDGAALDPTTGLFQWTPRLDQANTTNLVRIAVQDDGSPNLSAGQSFWAIALEHPRVTSIRFEGALVRITWRAFPGKRYRLQARDSLAVGDWADLPQELIATGETASLTDLPSAARRYYRVRAQ